MSINLKKDACETKRNIDADSKELQRIKQCLDEAGVDNEGMSVEEIKLIYRAINCSRDISVTVDSEASDNENAAPQPCSANKPTAIGGTPGLLRAKRATQTPDSLFKYKIPKDKRILKNTPLDSAKDQHSVKEFVTTRRNNPSTSDINAQSNSPRPISSVKRQSDNPFAALDDGDPRDLPNLKIRALERPVKCVPPEIAALNVPPPYNDPRIAALPYKERYAIIGKYMKDMQDMVVRLSRASGRKAVWGKPIVSSNRFKGTLDKVSTRVVQDASPDEMEIEMESFKDNSSEEDECTKSPSSSEICAEDPFRDVIETEASNIDTVKVRTNPKTQRKRKATTHHSDSLSDSDSTNNNDDSDYEDVKRKKSSSARLASNTTSSCLSTPSANTTPSISRSYAALMDNRPDITLTSVPGGSSRTRAGGRGGKSAVKTISNADIMIRSRLFKDSPMVKSAGQNKVVLSRSRRLMSLYRAEAARKDVTQQDRVRLEESLNAEEIDDIDDDIDNPSARIIDDDDNADFESRHVNVKRRRVPVPRPKCRPGVLRLPRQNPPQLESKLNSSGGDVTDFSIPNFIKIDEDEELPCPMCNIMFKSTIIQDHAENCEGPDSVNIHTIMCSVCDQVFLLNKDFEVHSLKCIRAAKEK